MTGTQLRNRSNNISFNLKVSHLTGEITGDDYDVRVIIDSIDIIVTDDVGDSSISGGMAYSRISTAGNFAERFETAGKNLNVDDDLREETITQINLNATRTRSGQFSIENPAQYGIIDPEIIAGPLTVTVLTVISGTKIDEPEQGKLQVEAQDGSNLSMTISSGDVVIEVDTDNDGTVDGTLSSEWMEMD